MGLPPAEFWDQSVTSFNWIMHGARERLRAQETLAVVAAWQGERFAREKTLRPLRHYLDEMKPRRRRKITGAEVLARFRKIAGAGLPKRKAMDTDG